MKEPIRPSRSNLWGQWANDVMDWVRSIIVRSSPTVKATYTTSGIFLEVAPQSGIGKGGEIPLIDQWDKLATYSAKDFAFCFRNTEWDTGTQAGLYQCIADVSGDIGNQEPADDPTRWRCVAFLHYQKFTMVKGTQMFVMDVGRDGSDPVSLRMYNDKDHPESGSTIIKLSDIPSTAGDKEIKLREIHGKDIDTGNCYKAVALISNWYT